MAESIRFDDKYIDTTGIYDSTLGKKQAEINTIVSKLNSVNVITLSSSGWSGSAPYTQTVAVSGMTAESVPVWGLYGTPTEAVYEAYCNITSMATSEDAVTFTCVSDKPESDVQIVIKGL